MPADTSIALDDHAVPLDATVDTAMRALRSAGAGRGKSPLSAALKYRRTTLGDHGLVVPGRFPEPDSAVPREPAGNHHGERGRERRRSMALDGFPEPREPGPGTTGTVSRVFEREPVPVPCGNEVGRMSGGRARFDFSALVGHEIPGGCDRCDALQVMTEDDDAPGVWHLQVQHDAGCPFLLALVAGAN